MTQPSSSDVVLRLADALMGLRDGQVSYGKLVQGLMEYSESIARNARSGVMSDQEIVENILRGHIWLHPLVPENIKGSSVDVRLGPWFYVMDRLDNQSGFNMFDPNDVKRYFGEPKYAIPHAQWSASHKGMRWDYIGEDELIIVWHPHERTLNHTLEVIGVDQTGTTMMKARSTIGRAGTVVCKDAGWGDPRYRAPWTMECQNDNDEMVAIPVGTRVGQLVFFWLGPTATDYSSSGKYDTGDTLEEKIRTWTPERMKPQAYKDVRGPVPDVYIKPGQDPKDLVVELPTQEEVIEILRSREEFRLTVERVLKEVA